MDPAEVEFIAEEELITIIPNFTSSILYLIAGDVGPFRAGLPLKVPLWMAMNLRQRQKCRIIAPDWMNLENLEALKEQETNSEFFIKMPNENYIVQANLILQFASEDIPQHAEIRTKLKDIWDVRMAKLRTSVDALIKSGSNHAKLDHLTLMEINSIRPLLPHAMDQLHRIQGAQASSSASLNITRSESQ